MSEPIQQQAGHHCPFLNRSDERCASNFSLERLNHALRHCFGDYSSCPTYLELLVERRARRAAAAANGRGPHNGGRRVEVFVHGQPVRAAVAVAAKAAGATGH